MTAIKIIKIIAIMLILSITTGNTIHAIKLINIQAPTQSYIQTVQYIIKKYPNQKFTIYDYEWKNSHISQPISLLLFKENRIDAYGIPIGITKNNKTQNSTIEYQIAYIGDTNLLDLSQYPKLKQDKKWVNVNPQSMYDDLMKWSKTEKLQSNFRLFKN